MDLPGIDLPVEIHSMLPFAGRRSNWHEYTHPITVRERMMIALMAFIKDKPDWAIKVFDDSIVDEWMSEALTGPVAELPTNDQTSESDTASDESGPETDDGDETVHFNAPVRQRVIMDKVFRYCIDELRDQASDATTKGFTEALEANATVYTSEIAIKHETKLALQSSVVPLEAVTNENPGSDRKVLNIAEPSLCPLIYGISTYLSEVTVPLHNCSEYIGRGEVVPAMDYTALEHPFDYSANYQWLSCEVSFDTNEGAKIVSCINGLHPEENQAMYAAIEEVISKSIPMWKMAVRSTLYRHEEMRLEPQYDHDHSTNGTEEMARLGMTEDRSEGNEHEDDVEAQQNEHGDNDGDTDNNDDNDNDNENQEGVHWLSEHYMRSPYEEVLEPESYERRMRSAGDEHATIFNQKFSSSNLQVIVRLTNVHLTPEKPTFDSDPWRVEGLPNEHICASAIYCYDSSNVTDSYIAFRESFDHACLNYIQSSSRCFGREMRHPHWWIWQRKSKVYMAITKPNLLDTNHPPNIFRTFKS